MRVIKEIQHQLCRITIFQWNGKYLIKFEQDNLEQTYKIDEFDVLNVKAVESIISEDFIRRIAGRFREMNTDLDNFMNS